jgi:hypothetical protein
VDQDQVQWWALVLAVLNIQVLLLKSYLTTRLKIKEQNTADGKGACQS